MPKSDNYPGTPGWVKAGAAVAVLMILLFIVMHVLGIAPTHH